MHTRIKFNRPLPLVVSLPGSVYEIWIELGDVTKTWSVAIGRLGDGTERSITVGMATRRELEVAMHAGVELSSDAMSQSVASELVDQDRAQFVDEAA